jgi:hypothetical protein
MVAVRIGAQCAETQGAARPPALNDEERAIVLGVRQATETGALGSLSDLCVGFGSKLVLNEKQVVRALNEDGAKVYPDDRCNHGPRGVALSDALTGHSKDCRHVRNRDRSRRTGPDSIEWRPFWNAPPTGRMGSEVCE